MKTKRCKYGHKIEHKTSIITKIKNFDYDKFFCLSICTSLIGYTVYLSIWK